MVTYVLHLVKRKNDYDEYKIVDKVNGEVGSYYTDDWDDAVGTFKMICQQHGYRVVCNDKRTDYKAYEQ